MNCQHFGVCGSCTLYKESYNLQVESKIDRLRGLLKPFYRGDIELFTSPSSHHRARAEFRIWHSNNTINYAMSNLAKDGNTIIQDCPKVLKPIYEIMNPLLEALNSSLELKSKLFGVEFLSGLSSEVLVTLLYHKPLNNSWIEEAKALSRELKISLIGRARKQRIVLEREYINETLKVDDKIYRYRHYEGSFTQPNPYINIKMLSWAKSVASSLETKDLLEAYCGLGNFTIPLSEHFNKVLATEISKTSIKSAKENLALNGISNISFARLSSKEMAQALSRVREFNRLKGIDLDSYGFNCALVDPPRAGLDSDTKELIKGIENIIYISCNPITLARDLEDLSQTHTIKQVALFDQFPYTNHIESGIFLRRSV